MKCCDSCTHKNLPYEEGSPCWGCMDAIGPNPYPNYVPRPTIVCLCGSTRFYGEFDKQNLRLTLAGEIVLSIGCSKHSDDELGLTLEQEDRLDELHKRKIDMCDYVLILNVNGYIGRSTRSEIEYAKKHGKQVAYLYPGLAVT